jgi:quercetin dioxygenase-like cupin family protein
VSYLSQIERDHVTPTLGTLAQIGRSLGVGLDYFVAMPKVSDSLVRAEHRRRFSLDGATQAYEKIGADIPTHEMSAFMIYVPPGYRSETVSHEGEEFMHVLDGEIDFTLDGERFTMRAGDSLHYRGNRFPRLDEPHGPDGPAALGRAAHLLPRQGGAAAQHASARNLPGRRRTGRATRQTGARHTNRRHSMKMLRTALLASVFALPLATPALYAATPDNVLVVAQNIDDIISLDPAQAYEFTAGELLTNIYDRLVQYEAEDPTVLTDGLAESWEIDAANKTITFQLRDAAFHSGNPVRGEDVIFSFERVVKLNLNPAFILTQLGWTPENIREMVTADGNTVTVRYTGDFSPTS